MYASVVLPFFVPLSNNLAWMFYGIKLFLFVTKAEDNDHMMLKSKRIKRRGIPGVMSDNEISRRGRSRGQVSKKVIRSDTKLVNRTKLNEKGFVRTSNSMNDLSLVKTPRNDESSVEDLQKFDDDMEERRRRPRQRSSSLDMGRGRVILFFRPLVLKFFKCSIPFSVAENLPIHKISTALCLYKPERVAQTV